MTDNNEYRTPYEEFVQDVREMIERIAETCFHLHLTKERREAVVSFTFEQVKCHLHVMQHGITEGQFYRYLYRTFQDNVKQFQKKSPALKRIEQIAKENVRCSLKNP